jgi:hypothetical protein
MRPHSHPTNTHYINPQSSAMMKGLEEGTTRPQGRLFFQPPRRQAYTLHQHAHGGGTHVPRDGWVTNTPGQAPLGRVAPQSEQDPGATRFDLRAGTLLQEIDQHRALLPPDLQVNQHMTPTRPCGLGGYSWSTTSVDAHISQANRQCRGKWPLTLRMGDNKDNLPHQTGVGRRTRQARTWGHVDARPPSRRMTSPRRLPGRRSGHRLLWAGGVGHVARHCESRRLMRWKLLVLKMIKCFK